MVRNERCHSCGKRIKYKANARERMYCDDACRQKAYRLRAKIGCDPIPIETCRDSWEQRGYPEQLIDHLVALCQGQADPVFLYHLESVLAWYEKWLKRNET